MSIIHEALQKTQQSLRSKLDNSNPYSKNVTRLESVDIFLVIIIAILLLIIIVAYYPRLATNTKRAEPILVVPSSPKPTPSLMPSPQPIAMAQPMQQVTMPPTVAMVQPTAMIQPQYVQYVAAPQPIQTVAMPQLVQYVAAPQPMQTVAMPQMIQAAPAPTLTSVSPGAQSAFFPNASEYKGRLVLNGVLLADQEKIALINNQPYHLGDNIDGMKIVSIELNSITLQDGVHTMVLRT